MLVICDKTWEQELQTDLMSHRGISRKEVGQEVTVNQPTAEQVSMDVVVAPVLPRLNGLNNPL